MVDLGDLEKHARTGNAGKAAVAVTRENASVS